MGDNFDFISSWALDEKIYRQKIFSERIFVTKPKDFYFVNKTVCDGKQSALYY